MAHAFMNVGLPVAAILLLLIAFLARQLVKARAALRLALDGELEFRLMFELSTTGKGQADPTTGQILRANLKLSEIVGYSEEELRSMTFLDLTHPDDRERDQLLFNQAVANSDCKYSNEKRYVRKDGQIVWVLTDITVLRDATNKAIRTVGTVVDITDRRRSEANLRESEARFRAIAETVENVFWIADRDKLIYVSPAYEKVWGRSLASLHADVSSYIQAIHPDDRAKVTDAFWRHRAGLQTIEHYRVVQPDGSIKWVCDRGFPVKGMGDQVERIVGIAEDVTERKQILEQLERAKSAAEIANKAKSVFLATMSHEIRTPLTAISGFSELLLLDPADKESRQRFAMKIHRNTVQLTRLIDDILDLSKVEAEKLDLDLSTFSLTSLIDEAVAMFAPQAMAKGVALTFQRHRLCPDWIVSDPTRLRQIVDNIVGNAVKFTESGAITITADFERAASGAANHSLKLTVADTGKGLLPSERPQLFKAFSRGERDTARLYGGTGLGLVLSKRLAQLLGGDVELTASTPGQGSTFAITIDPGPVAALATAVPRDAPRLVGATKEPELNGVRILVVEDGLDNQEFFSAFLGSVGAQVDIATDGRHGVQKALSGDYDVVLMDIQLPGLDGHQATQKLRREGFQKPIIALSAYAMEEDREHSLEAGCVEHLSKPVICSTLLAAIARHIHG